MFVSPKEMCSFYGRKKFQQELVRETYLLARYLLYCVEVLREQMRKRGTEKQTLFSSTSHVFLEILE